MRREIVLTADVWVQPWDVLVQESWETQKWSGHCRQPPGQAWATGGNPAVPGLDPELFRGLYPRRLAATFQNRDTYIVMVSVAWTFR